MQCRFVGESDGQAYGASSNDFASWITLPPLGEPKPRSASLPKFDFPDQIHWAPLAQNSSPQATLRRSSYDMAALHAPSVAALDRYAEPRFATGYPRRYSGAGSADLTPPASDTSSNMAESDECIGPGLAATRAESPQSRCQNARIGKGYDKVQHKVKERRRRGNIAKEMHLLRMLVPGCVPGCVGGPKETSKHECLQRTGTHIVNLQKQLADREREISELARQVKAAQASTEQVSSASIEQFGVLRHRLDQILAHREDGDAAAIKHLLADFDREHGSRGQDVDPHQLPFTSGSPRNRAS